MKKLTKILSIGLCVALVSGAAWAASSLKTDQEKRSYAVGASVAKNLKRQGLSLDPILVSAGLLDEMSNKSQLTEAEITAIVQQIQNETRQKQQAQQQKAAAENKQRGAAFLADYSKKEGVKSLTGGIQYRVLKAGKGKKPTDNDTVLCNYRGTLVDGKVFDASKAGTPTSFKVAQVIPGWRVALKQMPAGSKWEVVIPAEMAYGERGAGNAIGPNETLIFEVDLVSIQ